MKQFLTALAANFVTIALCVILSFMVIGGIAAAFATSAPPQVRNGSILIVDLDRPFSDETARTEPRGLFDNALLSGATTEPLRAATVAIRSAANDDRISGILIRGSVAGDGTTSGFAALKELREAIIDFKESKKPVHAWLVNPNVSSYYIASAADSVTLDPFGALSFPGLASEQVFLSGLLEKYGIGIQVSRVGRFKSAVEPYTRQNMSPENRAQVMSYLGDLWSEVKSSVSSARGVDTLELQKVVDSQGIMLPPDAQSAHLIDRVAYFDEVLDDLQRISDKATSTDNKPGRTKKGDSTSKADSTTGSSDLDALLGRTKLPQITLADYAPIALAKDKIVGASQVVAIVYAQGEIVDGEGSVGEIGGTALAREIRKLRTNSKVKAVVLRVNSPGGSVMGSERIQRELNLINKTKPVVVSMSSLAASGGYWISTASRLIFAEPNTITGSIGVFSVMPNIKGLASRFGVTFDTASTGKYAGMMSMARPRSPDELAVLQRSVDVIYDAFIDRVATARNIPADSIRTIAEGRVWSGSQAIKLGLVDSLGNLDNALRSAARLASITGDYEVQEFPRVKTQYEAISEMIDPKPSPVASSATATATAAKAIKTTLGTGSAGEFVSDMARELSVLSSYNDPRGLYARMPFILRIR